ncbi:hypothetical protein BDV25DRAFT_136511 [Aspergillus avenaceus]|uniref:DUF6590 domain-containing protein n=1 Tax=Aspergillus avenaceus TaxID=36643 RepID=A0A5N6U5A2_ASPAV|nr:hypothetical protein BDV25DRAFT_136511 [Aspergillus avenaceus]
MAYDRNPGRGSSRRRYLGDTVNRDESNRPGSGAAEQSNPTPTPGYQSHPFPTSIGHHYNSQQFPHDARAHGSRSNGYGSSLSPTDSSGSPTHGGWSRRNHRLSAPAHYPPNVSGITDAVPNVSIGHSTSGNSRASLPAISIGSHLSTQPPALGITPTPSPSRGLDSRYRIISNPRSFFRPGRVFAVLWTEGLGSTAIQAGVTSLASEEVYPGRFGELFYHSIRRMVVWRREGQCSWCFPVHTYGGRGVAKPGVDPTKHTIVHIEGTQPFRAADEPIMTKEPLEIKLTSPEERLDRMSRLNFGKCHTVEHNLKVLPIGEISDRSMLKFLQYAEPTLRGREREREGQS